MGWPGPIDYSEALQHPERSFADPRLGRSQVQANRRGLPAVRAGGFALVYRLNQGPTATAVRVFLYPSEEREERYRIVHDHLARQRPRCLIDFGYQPRGIRVGGDWYPVQTMPWIEGVTLGAWVHDAAVRGEVARLRRMAGRWVELVAELQAARIAHGDLQHGNVLIVGDDTPILVDYDGMCVPGLVGRPSLEVGLPAYQHPGRREQPLSARLDDFAAWIILIALRAVAADTALWRRFVVEPDNENQLFRESDIATHAKSPLWEALSRSPDGQVRAWSEQLRACLDGPFESIPPFRPDAPALPRPSARTAPVPSPVRAGVPPNRIPEKPAERSVGSILDALKAQVERPGDGRSLVRLWERHGARLAGNAEAARYGSEAERWAARIRAAEAFQELIRGASDESAIVRAWDQAVAVGGHPTLAVHEPRVRLARERLAAVEQLRRLPSAATYANDRAFDELWRSRRSLLAGCREVATLAPRQAEVAARLDRHRRLLAAIRDADRNSGPEQAILDVSASLPEAYDASLARRIGLVRRRTTAAPSSPPVPADQRLNSLLQAIRAGDHASFLSRVDLPFLRAHPDAFRPYRRVIEGWLRTHILRDRPIRPTVDPPVVRGSQVVIRATWGKPHLVSSCLLAARDAGGGPGEQAADPDTAVRFTFEQFRRAGGLVVSPPPGTRRLFVTIWPVVELGWSSLRGTALQLGPLQPTTASGDPAQTSGGVRRG